MLYDADRGEGERAEHLSAEIAELCVELGGSLSGEHGIGTDKACSMPKMFSEQDLTVMGRVRAGFDPAGRCNPGKLLPTPRLCGERPGPYRPHPLEAGHREPGCLLQIRRHLDAQVPMMHPVELLDAAIRGVDPLTP